MPGVVRYPYMPIDVDRVLQPNSRVVDTGPQYLGLIASLRRFWFDSSEYGGQVDAG